MAASNLSHIISRCTWCSNDCFPAIYNSNIQFSPMYENTNRKLAVTVWTEVWHGTLFSGKILFLQNMQSNTASASGFYFLFILRNKCQASHVLRAETYASLRLEIQQVVSPNHIRQNAGSVWNWRLGPFTQLSNEHSLEVSKHLKTSSEILTSLIIYILTINVP